MDEKTAKEIQEKYAFLTHAIQSGIAMELLIDSTAGTPKHLRVGINMAMVETAALGKILIQKGIITKEEYFLNLLENLEVELEAIKKRLSVYYGANNITLG